MIRCKILLSQGSKSLEVTIDKVIDASWGEIFTQWGKFSSLQPDGTSAGNIPPERKLWLHSIGKWELRLMDSGGKGVGMAGVGLKYGELASLEPVAILSNACITSRGVEPIKSNIGSGTITNGFAVSVSLNKGPVSWQLSAFQKLGSNAWVSP